MKTMFVFGVLLGFFNHIFAQDLPYTEDFRIEDCQFSTRHTRGQTINPYFIMEPGWWIALEGQEEDDEGEIETVRVEITVLNEIRLVAGVMTRVIEEREWIDDELYEVSRNFYAICQATNDIYYFGEEVDFYEDGQIVNHDGAWLAGENGAEPGIIMPGTVLLGSRFMQEIAEEDEAMDRAEIVSIMEMEIGGQNFEDVILTLDSSALEPDEPGEEKYYAPGIGNVKDGEKELIDYGWKFFVPKRWQSHVTRMNHGFETQIRFVNRGDEAEMILTPYNAQGDSYEPVIQTIAAEATLKRNAQDLFGEVEVSHFSIEGSDECLVFAAYQASAGNRIEAVVAEQSQEMMQATYFEAAWSDAFFDGVALVHTGTEEAAVTVVQLDASGNRVGQASLSANLMPFQKLQFVLGDLLENQPGGKFVVHSTQPFTAIALRGTVPGLPFAVLWSNELVQFHTTPTSVPGE